MLWETRAPQVDGPTSSLDECAALVYNIIELQIVDLGFDNYGNSCEVIRIGSGLRFLVRIRVFYPGENRELWKSGRWIQRSDFAGDSVTVDSVRDGNRPPGLEKIITECEYSVTATA